MHDKLDVSPAPAYSTNLLEERDKIEREILTHVTNRSFCDICGFPYCHSEYVWILVFHLEVRELEVIKL